VASYTFEYETEDGLSAEFDQLFGENTEVIQDDSLESNVLHLDSGCYARIVNPLQGASLQTGAGVTFWVKTARQDLESALFSFGDLENETSPNFYFTENAHLSYTVKGQLETLNLDVNNPSSVKTNAIGEGWHYVALQLLSNGYTLYVDGIKEAEQTLVSERSTSFSYQMLLNHLTTAPYFYLAAGSETALVESWFDDINFYTNSLTSKEITRPKKGLFASTTTEDPYENVKWLIVGPEDNSATFWTVWSDYVNLTGDGTIHYEFRINGSCANNWNFWGLVLTNGYPRDNANYSEWLFLRCDNYGWAANYDQTTITNDYDWTTYVSDMEGAYVIMDIVRKGETVTTSSEILCTNGKTLHYDTTTTGITSETLGTFFTCDGSHYSFNSEATFVGQVYNPGSYVVGAKDFSTAFWGERSSTYRFDEQFTNWGIEFVNYNTGSGDNWCNWILCCSNGPAFGEDGYAEHFVLRSDAFGWGGDAYHAENITNSFDWSTYVSDMNGATCKLLFDYVNNKLTMQAIQTTAEGVQLPDYSYEETFGLPFGLFLTVEKCYLDIVKVGYWPWIDKE
jgi:hypothetical protein